VIPSPQRRTDLTDAEAAAKICTGVAPLRLADVTKRPAPCRFPRVHRRRGGGRAPCYWYRMSRWAQNAKKAASRLQVIGQVTVRKNAVWKRPKNRT
jgi:hypothetical protein